MRIVAISDTHTKHKQLTIPDGDVLIHAGDATWRGAADKTQQFDYWLMGLPHKHKLFVPGNHDFFFEKPDWHLKKHIFNSAEVLIDRGVEIEGVKFWGSPWVRRYGQWAFMIRGKVRKLAFDLIPDDTDVLITHGPPLGILDRSKKGEHCGCQHLKKRVLEVKPKYHFFGHIHEGRGGERVEETEFYNVSSCTRDYNCTNEPVVVDV